MSLKVKFLAKIAALGGATATFSGYYFHRKIETNLKQGEYFTKSLQILRDHKGISYHLGPPIYDGKIDLGDTTNNYCNGTEARFQIPVKGSKRKGVYYIFATREETSNPWDIQRLELALEDTPGKRILVLDNNKSKEDNLLS